MCIGVDIVAIVIEHIVCVIKCVYTLLFKNLECKYVNQQQKLSAYVSKMFMYNRNFGLETFNRGHGETKVQILLTPKCVISSSWLQKI